MAKEFTYEIKKHIGVLSDTGTLTMELSLISYNGAEPKFDLRKWRMKDDKPTMQKGVTMTRDELLALRDLLNSMEEI
jgi:hypothetical protein